MGMEGLEGSGAQPAGDSASIWQIDVTTGIPRFVNREGFDEALCKEPSLDPTHLDTSHLSKFLDVTKDKLSVQYTGPASHENDVGCISANRPFNREQTVCYFEVHALFIGKNPASLTSCLSIGFADQPFKMGRLPGVEPRSYGYSDMGDKMACLSSEDRPMKEPWGEEFNSGDVIGAGINLKRREIFFTLNGKFLGSAFTRLKSYPWIATIGLHGHNTSIAVNFGQKAFRFQPDSVVDLERQRLDTELNQMELPSLYTRQLVLDYLKFYGYQRTYSGFRPRIESETGRPQELDRSRDKYYEVCGKADEQLRRIMRHHAEKGNGAEDVFYNWKISQRAGNNASRNTQALVFLSTAALIELMRKQDWARAIEFGRSEVRPLLSSVLDQPTQSKDNPKAVDPKLLWALRAWEIVAQTMSLLSQAHEVEHTRQLMTRQQQENLMDAACIALHREALEANEPFDDIKSQSSLEGALLHLRQVMENLHKHNLSMGPQFRLSDHISDKLLSRGNELIPGASENKKLDVHVHVSKQRKTDLNGSAAEQRNGHTRMVE